MQVPDAIEVKVLKNNPDRLIRKPSFGASRAGRVLAWVILACLVTGCEQKSTPDVVGGHEGQEVSVFRFEFDPSDSAVVEDIETYLAHGAQLIEAYFGEPLEEGVVVEVHPSRDSFTASFPPEWGMSETACWMVAAGVSDRLIILSPRVWGEEACEHDPDDARHVQDIVVHELVHVFHGRRNPTGDFTGAEEVGWFVEGLAVHVSGQLGHGHMAEPQEAIVNGVAPVRLADAWSGKYRYGVSGSLVEYLDVTYGREVIRKMLAVTNQAELLALAGVTEDELLEQWRLFVTAEPE